MIELLIALCAYTLYYFQVFAIVADGLAANRNMFKCMGPDSDGLPYATANMFASDIARKLYLTPDPSHLLKTTRNCVYSSRGRSNSPSRLIHRNGRFILWDHFCYVESKNVSKQHNYKKLCN